MCHSNQQWLVPIVSVSKIGQRTIIKAATHTESVTFAVECDQWKQDQVKCPGGDGVTPFDIGFIDSESVG